MTQNECRVFTAGSQDQSSASCRCHTNSQVTSSLPLLGQADTAAPNPQQGVAGCNLPNYEGSTLCTCPSRGAAWSLWLEADSVTVCLKSRTGSKWLALVHLPQTLPSSRNTHTEDMPGHISRAVVTKGSESKAGPQMGWEREQVPGREFKS